MARYRYVLYKLSKRRPGREPGLASAVGLHPVGAPKAAPFGKYSKLLIMHLSSGLMANDNYYCQLINQLNILYRIISNTCTDTSTTVIYVVYCCRLTVCV